MAKKGHVLSISLSFPYDVRSHETQFEALVMGGEHAMSAIGPTAYLAKEELRRELKMYIQGAINRGIPLPKFLEVR